MEKWKTNCKKYILHITVYWYFLATSLSNLVNNISERIHKIKFKYRYDDKNFQTCRNKYKYCDCFLEYINFKDDLIEYKCLRCNKKLSTQVWWKNDFLVNTNFLTKTIISLFYCCEKVFILMNIWMIGKNSIKRNCLKKKIFTAT